MFEIAFTACSILVGAHCKDLTLSFADEGQSAMPYACMMPAMSELAKWRDANPNYSIARWRCGAAGQFAKA